eukprot:gene13742-16207_t
MPEVLNYYESLNLGAVQWYYGSLTLTNQQNEYDEEWATLEGYKKDVSFYQERVTKQKHKIDSNHQHIMIKRTQNAIEVARLKAMQDFLDMKIDGQQSKKTGKKEKAAINQQIRELEDKKREISGFKPTNKRRLLSIEKLPSISILPRMRVVKERVLIMDVASYAQQPTTLDTTTLLITSTRTDKQS